MTNQKTGTQADARSFGPLDILVLEFPGNHFNGDILRNLNELVGAGTIRILDLVIISKNQAGVVSALELNELGGEMSSALAPLHASISQMITREDIDSVGAELDNNSTAAILITENVWALKTKQAMLAANGKVVMFERIPHQVVQDALDDLAAMGMPVA
ncbi:MAG TPA: DUF6325 family protein [Caldilineaceae bacterium]|nr:DUF6325 family protein [Caldilineaceae bacterium]